MALFLLGLFVGFVSLVLGGTRLWFIATIALLCYVSCRASDFVPENDPNLQQFKVQKVEHIVLTEKEERAYTKLLNNKQTVRTIGRFLKNIELINRPNREKLRLSK